MLIARQSARSRRAFHAVAVLRAWLDERGGALDDPLFSTSRGRPLSRDAVGLLVARHAGGARKSCPSLKTKVAAPHVLRHGAAMALLPAGVDVAVIAPFLSHAGIETTQLYIHADHSIKERTLAHTAPLGTTPGRYLSPDDLMVFLESL